MTFQQGGFVACGGDGWGRVGTGKRGQTVPAAARLTVQIAVGLAGSSRAASWMTSTPLLHGANEAGPRVSVRDRRSAAGERMPYRRMRRADCSPRPVAAKICGSSSFRTSAT